MFTVSDTFDGKSGGNKSKQKKSINQSIKANYMSISFLFNTVCDILNHISLCLMANIKIKMTGENNYEKQVNPAHNFCVNWPDATSLKDKFIFSLRN